MSSDSLPRWIDGPPIPLQCLVIPGSTPGRFLSLRWRCRDQEGRPETVVDRPVFEAAVYAAGSGQEVEGSAILESLGYAVSAWTPRGPGD